MRIVKPTKTARMGLTFNDITAALTAALGPDPDKDGDEDYSYVIDVDPEAGTFVYGCDGQTYQQAYTIDASGKASLAGVAVPVVPDTDWKPVGAFEFPIASFGAPIGNLVPWGPCKIFECNHYPAQGIDARDPAYLDHLVQTFPGKAPIKDTHSEHQSIFAGKLGDCQGVERRGRELFGWGTIPRAVKDLAGKGEFKASIEIDRGTNQLTAIALLNFPQVEDAVISAMFAKFAGARHSKADMEHVQAVHDHAASLGATCPPEDSAQMGGSRHSKSDADAIQQMHDLAVSQGAACTSGAQMGAIRQPNDSAGKAKETRMSWKDKAKAWFSGNPQARQQAGISDSEFATEDTAPVAATLDPALAARLASFEEQARAQQVRLDQQDAILLGSRAAEFARDAIEVQKKALPSERAELEGMYIMAAKADGGGVAKFGADGTVTEGANVKIVRDSIAKRRALGLFESHIKDATAIDETGRHAARESWAQSRLASAVGDYNK